MQQIKAVLKYTWTICYMHHLFISVREFSFFRICCRLTAILAHNRSDSQGLLGMTQLLHLKFALPSPKCTTQPLNLQMLQTLQ